MKKTIFKKTLQAAIPTAISRILGYFRVILEIRYLGIGVISDAFNTAFRIPNTLRKIFAEGALSAALVPTLVSLQKDDKEFNRLVTLTLFFIMLLVGIICSLITFYPNIVIYILAPGFKTERAAQAAKFLTILISYIFFIATSAVCTGSLQAKNHFLTPFLAPAVSNIILVSGLLLCIYKNLNTNYFCYFILFSGFLQLVMVLIASFRHGLTLELPTKETIKHFKSLLKKFLPCIFSVGIIEINLIIDNILASYLPVGSISILRYSFDFTRIALGIFAVSFSQIMLTHMSKVVTYAPKRLSFYLHESTKLVMWVTVPVTIFTIIFAQDIFKTFLIGRNFSLEYLNTASNVLIAFSCGLFFFSINKVLLSIYYSLNETFLSSLISLACAIINTVLNWILMQKFQAVGIAAATTISAIIQTFLLVYILIKKFDFKIYLKNYQAFLQKFFIKQAIIFSCFFFVYQTISSLIIQISNPNIIFLKDGFGVWLWSAPLILLALSANYFLKDTMKIKLYFIV